MNDTLLNHKWVKNKSQEKLKKYFEITKQKHNIQNFVEYR